MLIIFRLRMNHIAIKFRTSDKMNSSFCHQLAAIHSATFKSALPISFLNHRLRVSKLSSVVDKREIQFVKFKIFISKFQL